jgi:predicted GNAT family N-acyltransferase
MPFKEILYGSPDYHRIVELRSEVLRMPLGLTFTQEELMEERNDLFLAAIEKETASACCILTRENTEEVRLRQMAVKPGLQRKGIGRSLLQFAESIARERGYHTLSMHARLSAREFYENQGYEAYGDTFEEVSIPHIRMKKKL